MEELQILSLDKKPGRTATIKGKEYLFFSGYNYLGINSEPEFKELIAEGIDKFGWLFPSSRISNTRLSIFEECEALLSEMTGCEDTVLLPSGFAAGRLATAHHPSAVYNSPGSHPAILHHKPEFKKFSDWSAWLSTQLAMDKADAPKVVASDSLNPFVPEVYDFSFLSTVKSPLVAVIDDSHGIGLIGDDGKGVSSYIPKKGNIDYLFTYSLSKAFGISGGAVSCSRKRVDYFKKSPEYASVTPLSPASIYAFTKGQHIYQKQREKLMANIAYFESCIEDLPFIEHVPAYPVFTLPPFLNEDSFNKRKILISSFAYPDPNGKKIKRVVLNALHTKADLDMLYQALRTAYRESVSNISW